MEDDGEEVPQLSATTLAALHSFLREQEAEKQQEEDAEEEEEYEMVKEDWKLSQFWYDANTAKTVAEELHLLSAASTLSIACIACPSLYTQLKKRYPEGRVCLFEFDRRFSRYGTDFTFYDYNRPLDIPAELRQSFHVIVADPPYLSEECLEKSAETMRFLAKDPETSPFMLLTGGVQRENVFKFLKAHPCRFRPVHENKLGNEFMLFTNYNPESRLGGWEVGA